MKRPLMILILISPVSFSRDACEIGIQCEDLKKGGTIVDVSPQEAIEYCDNDKQILSKTNYTSISTASSMIFKNTTF